MHNVLIIDDNEKGAILLKKGLEVTSQIKADCAYSGEEGVKICLEGNYDCVLMDLNLPGINGIDTMLKIKKELPYCPVIMITGHNDIQTAVLAIKKGAYDYLVKPLDLDVVADLVGRSSNQVSMQRKIEAFDNFKKMHKEDDIVVDEKSSFNKILNMAQRVATSDTSVLITGESGTGKELVAKMIHNQSSRANQPFVEVNCGAIPQDLMESEFFGHEKGAFTGANASHNGFFSIANKGTIFLDEIGEMPISLQVKLLRTLQSGEVRRVGGAKLFHVDVRVIAATSRDLTKSIELNTFREDLYYRLNVVNLAVPPLRERKCDIPVLVQHFLSILHPGDDMVRVIEDEAIQKLMLYDWPGNIRELKNFVERLMLFADEKVITKEDVLKDSLINKDANNFDNDDISGLSLAKLEERQILTVLEKCEGNKTQAAKNLGITVQTLYNKLSRMKGELD